MIEGPFTVSFVYRGCKLVTIAGRLIVSIGKLRISYSTQGSEFYPIECFDARELARSKHPRAANEIARILRKHNIPLMKDEFIEVGDVIYSWASSLRSLRERWIGLHDRIKALENHVEALELRRELEHKRIGALGPGKRV